MTPVELNIYARAYAEQQTQIQRLRSANIYSLAVLIRSMVWSKHPPSYERAFPGGKASTKKKEEMTDDAMYAMVKGLNALFGGAEVD